LRIEERASFKEDIPLEQGIKEAVNRPLDIVNAFEILKNKNMKEEVEESNIDNSF